MSNITPHELHLSWVHLSFWCHCPVRKQSVCSDTNCCRCSGSNPTRSTKTTWRRKEEDIPKQIESQHTI